MPLNVKFSSMDEAGVTIVETVKVPGSHLSVGNGLVVVDDVGSQVFAVPLERLISVQKVA
jgi:hypothetical protein